MKRKIIIGSRGSELALWQANYTKTLLEELEQEVEIRIIQTEGDRSQTWGTSFDKLEGKGFFTKELEEALLNKSIDLAVHSHKDLPTENPYGLIVAGVSKREDPSELLLARKDILDEKEKFGIRKNALVGTSSARRKSQLLAFRPDLQIKDLRGNVPTRIQKLREGQYDAILLASAGVERLGINLEEFHSNHLSPFEFIPAPAQGVLAWQCREDDDLVLELIDQINDFDVRVKVNIEREVLSLFDGGCQLPLGAYCISETDEEDRLKFRLWLSVAESWDQQPKQFYFETLDTDGFTDQVVDHVKGLKPKKVFITKNLHDDDYLPRALSKLGFSIEGKSLIEFKMIRIKELPKTDWIFFSSKHAVRYFFKQKPQTGAVKYACLGTGTSAELRAHGHRADFIGQSTDTKLVGKQFSSKVGNAKVLFPIARGSLQSIQRQMLKWDNVFNLEVYATLKQSVQMGDDVNVIVFTSPSNVEAWFEKNSWKPHHQAVAMGDATGKMLEKFKVKTYAKPQSFDDLGLVQAILSLPNVSAPENSESVKES
ncbi:MAG TPA: hydroxymethylbilane synthase [Bacteroidia bacterium]|nr:hydroxymethylbilane synthase [Bacteroidia bacterium]